MYDKIRLVAQSVFSLNFMTLKQENKQSASIDSAKIDALVKKAQAGDTDAFGEIYNELLTPIYRYIYFKVGPEIAEDLTEDVFFKAWKSLNSYKKQGNFPFSAWLFRIAHNLVVDYYRTNQPIEELPMDVVETREFMNPRFQLESSINVERLYAALKKLSHSVEQAIILRFINDLNYSEIAKIMNKTEGSIRVLIHRGLKQLKEILAK